MHQTTKKFQGVILVFNDQREGVEMFSMALRSHVKNRSIVAFLSILMTVFSAPGMCQPLGASGDIGPSLERLEKQKSNIKKRAMAHLGIANIYARQLGQYHIALDYYQTAITEAERNTKAKDRQRVVREAEDGYRAGLEALLQSIETPRQILEIAVKDSSKYYLS